MTYGVMTLPGDQFAAFDDAMLSSDPYLREEGDAILYSSEMDGNPFTYVLVGPAGETYLASDLALIEELKLAFP